MKTLVGHVVSFTTAALLALPFVSSAQNVASQPGHIDRSVERFTLLTGPSLLSPAKGYSPAGTLTLSGSTPAPEAPRWSFVPGGKSAEARARMPGSVGTLTLGPATSTAPAPALKSLAPANANLFRFDSTLHPAGAPLDLKAARGLKHD